MFEFSLNAHDALIMLSHEKGRKHTLIPCIQYAAIQWGDKDSPMRRQRRAYLRVHESSRFEVSNHRGSHFLNDTCGTELGRHAIDDKALDHELQQGYTARLTRDFVAIILTRDAIHLFCNSRWHADVSQKILQQQQQHHPSSRPRSQRPKSKS